MVTIYYVIFVKVVATGSSLPDNGTLFWVSLLFPLFLTPYLFGIMRNIRKHEVFVFDGVTGDLRKNGISLIRLDQIIDVRLKAVNGICEELSLSVHGENNVSIELPVDGPTDRVADVASVIASMSNVEVQFIQT